MSATTMEPGPAVESSITVVSTAAMVSTSNVSMYRRAIARPAVAVTRPISIARTPIITAPVIRRAPVRVIPRA